IAAALRQHATAVIFGALTTAAAFLCLLLSESPGFMQLGVLIAAGIILAGALMMTVFFAMLGKPPSPRKSDAVARFGSRLVELSGSRPWRVIAAGGGILLAACAVLVLPFGELRFDANPRSLEPRNSRAGTALREIQKRMPVAAEPILVLLESEDRQE